MAYFNHAFCKSFLATDASASNGDLITTLAPGEVALVNDTNWTVHQGTTVPSNSLTYIVQGSYRSDILGGNSNHGGYGESIKSKGINPKYLTRIWESSCVKATNSYASVEVGPKCHPCGENLMLRVDVKGSPALRFLNRNAYAIGDSMGDAASGDVPGLCCAAGQTYLDPAVALAKMGRMILEDPITKDLIAESEYITGIALSAPAITGVGYSTATNVPTSGGTGTGLTVDITVDGTDTDDIASVTINNPGSGYTNGDIITIEQSGATTKETATLTVEAAHGITVNTNGSEAVYSIAEVLDGTYVASTDPVGDNISAKLTFKGAYVSTEFADSSFDTRDFYGKEPVQVRMQMIDETGEPCNDCGTVTHVPGIMQQTTGETVLRHLLLSERYMQNPVHQGNADFNRMREIEGSDAIIAAVDRTALYKTYYVQHSVPRFNNPTSTFDNDQYVYEIFVKCTDTTTQGAIEGLLDHLADANSSVSRETSIDQ